MENNILSSSSDSTYSSSLSSSSLLHSQGTKRPLEDTDSSYNSSYSKDIPANITTDGVSNPNVESQQQQQQPRPPRRRRFETSSSSANTTTNTITTNTDTASIDGNISASSVDTTVQTIEIINGEILKLEEQIKTLRNAVGIPEHQRESTIQAIEQIIHQKREEITKLAPVASSKLHLPSEALNNPALTAILASLNKTSATSNAVLTSTSNSSSNLQSFSTPNVTIPANSRIYVGSLHYDLTEADLRMVFSPFGKIKSLDIVRDNATGRSRGYCFISFETEESADLAINTMNGYQLAGRAIRVNRPVPTQGGSGGGIGGGGSMMGNTTGGSNSNSSSSSSSLSSMGAHTSNPNLYAYGDHIVANMGNITEDIHTYVNKLQQTKPGYRIYIGAIPYELTASHIKQIFAPFGALRSVILLPSQEASSTTAGHRGYGFIEYEDEKAGKLAIDNMNGFEISGRKLKVGQAASTSNSNSNNYPGNSSNTMFGSSAVPSHAFGNSLPSAMQNPLVAMTSIPANNYLQMTGLPNMGLPLNLLTTTTPNTVPPPVTIPPSTITSVVPIAPQQTVNLPSQPALSRIIAIRNMVMIDEADDPELPEEIKEEAEKVGKVDSVHIYKHRNQQNVTVFIIYNGITEAQAGIQKLDKRYFGGRITSAVFYPEEAYHHQQYE